MLKEIVEQKLKADRRTFDWLCTELEMTPQGLRGALTNETLKFKDFKKLLKVLNISANLFFEASNYTQKETGYNNTTGIKSSFTSFNEDLEIYEVQLSDKEKLIQSLEKQLQDKEKIIQLLESR